MAAVPVLAADQIRRHAGPAACEEPPSRAAALPGGATFYVAPDGDDANAGTDAANPWKTISRVNAQLAAGAVGAGDTVLFSKGGTFFGKIRPMSGADRYLTFSSYPEPTDAVGRPVISSYKILNSPAGWNRLNRRTWTVDLSEAGFGDTHTGYDGAEGGSDNVGFLRVDGVVHGRRVDAIEYLDQQWDFCCAGERLHVRSDSNPTTLAADIRAACDTPCLSLRDYVAVRGLRFEGSGGHGIQGSASHVRVADNELAELGGSFLSADTRYGNGVEIWIGSDDVIVENNVIHDVYDAALTMQGSADSASDGWREIAFRGNSIFRCNQSVEFWSAAQGHAAPGFVGCVVEGNVCLFAGRGWSYDVRPDLDTGVHLLTYGWELPADIRLFDNVFYDGRSAYRYSAEVPTGLIATRNAVMQRAGALLQWGGPQVVEQSGDWVADRGDDEGSTFIVLPVDSSLDVETAFRTVAGLVPDHATGASWAADRCR